jgi:hypothetical protein
MEPTEAQTSITKFKKSAIVSAFAPLFRFCNLPRFALEATQIPSRPHWELLTAIVAENQPRNA